MRKQRITSHGICKRWLAWLLPACLAFGLGEATGHPMPNSAVLLDIQAKGVQAQLQLPLNELQLAYGHDVAVHPETLVARLGDSLRFYIAQHIRPTSPNGSCWTVTVGALFVQPVRQSSSGPYYELTAEVWLIPPTEESVRHFTFQYDVIVHQLVTHKILVSIRQDWDQSIFAEHPVEVGIIQLDVPSNTIPPLVIDHTGGSWWIGFTGMVKLGIGHIAEGPDHLLFLLVLLLPAPLLINGKLGRRARWGRFGGVRYSLSRLVWIVTAFTLGHSITLLLGALGWVQLPARLVEMLIAVSILVSAVHALRPLFPGREAWVAACFGLVHGLAFATTLANLNLDSGRMALSILGFNLGIELMQLVVIGLTIPWLLLLSQTSLYGLVRVSGAVFAGVAALGWLVERYQGKVNMLAVQIDRMTNSAPWLLAWLAVLALVSWWIQTNSLESWRVDKPRHKPGG